MNGRTGRRNGYAMDFYCWYYVGICKVMDDQEMMYRIARTITLLSFR